MSDSQPVSVAERIRERMELLNLNPYRTAKKAGLGPDYVRDILRGKVKQPSAERLGRLAEALETDLQYILGFGTNEIVEPLPPPALAATTASTDKTSVLLPIRFELMGEVFRTATEVTRRPLGFEAATIPPAWSHREHWYELLRDDSMSRIAPAGSLLHVVAMDELDRPSMIDGDIVIIVKRIVEKEANFHIVERSARRVTHRYPDLGLWFLDYDSFNEDWPVGDDVFREEPVRRPVPHPDDNDWSSELRSTLYEGNDSLVEGALKRLEGTLSTPKELEAFLEEHRKRRSRVVGKVIRVLTAYDARAKFGLRSDI